MVEMPPTVIYPTNPPQWDSVMWCGCGHQESRGRVYAPSAEQSLRSEWEKANNTICVKPEKEPKKTDCTWVEQQEGDWHTACGQGAYDDPIALELTYCAYCGRRIEAQPFKEAKK